LREKLSTQPDHLIDKFTERNLRRAYNEELADIISLIRHAVKGGELLTAERRVDRALMKVRSDRSFTPEQERWLALIRTHLIENLLLERDDFETLPIFTREGASWGKLNRIFGDQFGTIVQEINQAIALKNINYINIDVDRLSLQELRKQCRKMSGRVPGRARVRSGVSPPW
jgi:type I restriction enzyme R subunit